MRGFLKEGGLGGASFLESCLCPYPVPALRPECLCFPRLRRFSVDPGMGLVVLDLVRAQVGTERKSCALGSLTLSLTVQVGPTRWFLGNPQNLGFTYPIYTPPCLS